MSRLRVHRLFLPSGRPGAVPDELAAPIKMYSWSLVLAVRLLCTDGLLYPKPRDCSVHFRLVVVPGIVHTRSLYQKRLAKLSRLVTVTHSILSNHVGHEAGPEKAHKRSKVNLGTSLTSY